MKQRSMNHPILLRDVVAEDLPIFFEHQRDPVAVEMAAFSSRNRDDFMEHWAKIAADETSVAKTVVFLGEVAGNVVSWEQDGQRCVGYWLGRSFWGKGVATRALSALLQILPFRPLFAHVAMGNPASLRVLQKCGFAIAGEAAVSLGDGGGEVGEYVLVLREEGGGGV